MPTLPSAPIADRVRALLAGLVGFDTVSDRSNLPLIAYIEDYLAHSASPGSAIGVLEGSGLRAGTDERLINDACDANF